ncbi:hypothetical protein [Acetobacter garciniae]|nr:hypothetical protein [Acetobacter garciniae]
MLASRIAPAPVIRSCRRSLYAQPVSASQAVPVKDTLFFAARHA